MNILQFLRIFWARRYVTLGAMAATLLGAVVVVLLVQPRYEATARVLLNMLVRPDPVTGEAMNARGAGPFIDAQMELIKDYSVTGRVVDQSGWLSDPGRIRAYSGRSPSDTRDFRRWLAQQVADNTVVKVMGSGTVLEITYKGPTAQIAAGGAEVMRQAYLDQSLQARREAAARNAAFYNKQADTERALAETAEAAKAAYEKQTGIIMQGRDTDLDSDRLASLSGQAVAPQMAMPSPQSPAALQLAQIDAQLSDASRRLGPNHPEIIELKARREAVARVASQEAASARAMMSGQAGAAAISRALQEQKSRVIGQREQVEKLRQLQSEADLRREQYRTASAKAGQFAVEAAVTDTGLEPLGVVVTPSKAAFPNKPLMLGGALALGLAMGMALSLLLELLNRRVRSAEDLQLSEDIHCIGVLEEPTGNDTGRKVRRVLRGLIPKWVGAAT
jgi:succinoglycan biosynthesis transport protein ExoP